MMLNIFSCALLPSACLFWWSVYSNQSPNLKIKSSIFSFLSYNKIYSRYKSFIKCVLFKYFFPACGLLIQRAEIFNFHEVQFISFFLSWTAVLCPKESLLNQKYKDVLFFFSRNFIAFKKAFS